MWFTNHKSYSINRGVPRCGLWDAVLEWNYCRQTVFENTILYMYIPASRGEPFCSWFYRAPLCWAELRQGQHRRLLWCIHRQTLINSPCEWLQKSSPAAGNGFPFDWSDMFGFRQELHIIPAERILHCLRVVSLQLFAYNNCIIERFHIALFHEKYINIFGGGRGSP